MKYFVTVFLLVCVFALGVHSRPQETEFDDFEATDYNRPSETRRPAPGSQWNFGPTTRRPRPPGPTRPRPTRPRPTTTTERSNTVNPGIDGNGQLIGCRCQSTHETNPVCGTDGNTYGNPAKLRCAQKCGQIVEEKFSGRCSGRS